MRSGPVYTVGRLFAVLTRPLILFVANNRLAEEQAVALAVAFLACSLAMVGIAAAPDRRFYASHFSPERSINGFAFYLYATSVLVLVSVGTLMAASITAVFVQSFALVSVVGGYLASEKLADEMLRLRLFERDFVAWGRAALARSLAQLGGCAAVLAVSGAGTSAWAIVLALLAGNLLVFIPQLPQPLWRSIAFRKGNTIKWLVRRAVRSLARNWILWAIALVGASIGYLDRLVAVVVDTAMLPLFMLVVMCFSLVQMAVDFYYVSRHRRDFLEGRISVADALLSREFVVSIGCGFVVSVVACATVLVTSRNGAIFPLGYVAIIAILQVSMAIATIPREILYWTRLLHWILAIEIAFWLSFATAALVGWLVALPAMAVFWAVAGCAVMRLLLFVTAGGRKHEYSLLLRGHR
jgi:hypothetical protein